MAVSSFTLNISGTVGLSDNSVESFLGTYDPVGGIFLQVGASDAFRVNYPSKKSEIEDLDNYDVNLLPSSFIDPGTDPADTGAIVDSLAMTISGRVAYDDDSHKNFSYEVGGTGIISNHAEFDNEGNDAWESIGTFSSSPESNAIIIALLEALYSAIGDPISISLGI